MAGVTTSAPDGRLPVTLITGYLGSGKTTLLNHLLRQPELCRSAVIINEFGAVAVDHLLVSVPAENMVLLDTGCLCCTVRGDLVQTLTDLDSKARSATIPSFSNVIIETTGLADPVPVLQSIVVDEVLRRIYRLQDVVTVIDAVHGAAQLDRQDESLKQAVLADALLISKGDLAGQACVSALRARLARLNPAAEIHEVVHGAIDPAVLLRDQPHEAAAAANVERWLREAQHTHTAIKGAHSDAGIRAFSLYREQPIRHAGLALWLDMLSGLRGANLLRVKGVLNVEGEPCVVHAVQTVVHEPVMLEAWPTDDRRSRLVVIARDMTLEEVERTFTAFDYAPQPQSRAIDPHAYAQFVAAMKGFQR